MNFPACGYVRDSDSEEGEGWERAHTSTSLTVTPGMVAVVEVILRE
jgi:hypothetical protein